MSDGKSENAAEASASGGAPSSGKATIIGGFVGVLLVVAGGVAVGIVGFPGGPNRDPKKEHVDPMVDETAVKPTVLLSVPQMVVNLSDTTGKHLLQSQWTVEIAATDVGAATTKFTEWLPRVQDQMIKVISSYRSVELEGGSNKEFVQTRIKDALNATVFKSEEAKVKNVYFTEFVIQ
jgi:flagellar basal body-associated protein FliL